MFHKVLLKKAAMEAICYIEVINQPILNTVELQWLEH